MKEHKRLSDIGREQPFEVPDNYFRDLPERIMEQCEAREKKRSFIHILKPALSLAAMFVGVALIAYFAIQLIDQPENKTPYGKEDIAEAEYYDQYYNQDEMMDDLKGDETIEAENDSEKTKEYIEYLLNEDIDYTTLINELKEKQKEGKDNQ